MCFPVNIPKVLGVIILGAAFELSFNIRKEFLKTKVSGDIAFALISLVLVQIQKLASSSTTTEHLSFLQNFYKKPMTT